MNTEERLQDLQARIEALEKSNVPRYRANVSTTSKGLPSINCTVDGQGSGMSAEEVLAEVNAMVEAQTAHYPTEVPL